MATEFATEVIDLPSEGKFYPSDSPLASGQIELKFMTALEEDILTSTNLRAKNLVFDKLYESLIVNKDIHLDDILTGDINAIMVASRILGYGKDYPVTVQCPNCRLEQDAIADLTKLNDREEIPSTVTRKNDTFTVELPISKAQVEFRLLTRGLEKQFQAELNSYQKINAAYTPETTTFLRYILVSVNGVTTAAEIAKFVNSMLVRDSVFLKKMYSISKPDINFEFNLECDSCSQVNPVRLPIGYDFFWPDF